MTSEWLGETAFALKDVLGSKELPDRLRQDIAETVEAMRTGFRQVGAEPNF